MRNKYHPAWYCSTCVINITLPDIALLGVWLLSDVSYSDECRMKKYFQYAENVSTILCYSNIIIIIFFYQVSQIQVT